MIPESASPKEAALPRKLVDEPFSFRGYSDREPSGVCRVRIYERSNEPPVIVLTELPENETTSITNLAEQLWPEVIAKYLPHRFDYPEPAICLEHYPIGRRFEHRSPRNGNVEIGSIWQFWLQQSRSARQVAPNGWQVVPVHDAYPT